MTQVERKALSNISFYEFNMCRKIIIQKARVGFDKISNWNSERKLKRTANKMQIRNKEVTLLLKFILNHIDNMVTVRLRVV